MGKRNYHDGDDILKMPLNEQKQVRIVLFCIVAAFLIVILSIGLSNVIPNARKMSVSKNGALTQGITISTNIEYTMRPSRHYNIVFKYQKNGAWITAQTESYYTKIDLVNMGVFTQDGKLQNEAPLVVKYRNNLVVVSPYKNFPLSIPQISFMGFFAFGSLIILIPLVLLQLSINKKQPKKSKIKMDKDKIYQTPQENYDIDTTRCQYCGAVKDKKVCSYCNRK